MSSSGPFVPNEWSDTEVDLYLNLVNDDPLLAEDRMLQALYHEGFFESDITPREREEMREGLRDYMWDEYGLDFDIEFDWDGYRDWYDSQ